MSISTFSLKKPFLSLAPMAGLTHAAFRALVADYGGVDLFFTEMLNVRALVFQNPEKDPYLIRARNDRPLWAQLVGREPELFAKAVQRLEERFDFDGYDLNCGCTRGAIQRYGWGVALMKEPKLAAEILAAIKENAPKPVSAKLRSGFDHKPDQLLSFVEALAEAGLDLVTLHPRAANEGFKRRPRWEEIKLLKESFPSLIVVGNGDVFGPEEALKMLAQTGCDGVMIGRAALMRPWIFRDVKAFLEKGQVLPPPPPTEAPEKMAHLIEALLPPELHEPRFELWLFWYLQNFDFGLHYFGQIKRQRGLAEKLALLKRLLAREKIKPYPAKPYLLR